MPNSVIDDIEKMINAFWWGGRSNNRGIKWMAWERVACPKEFGGMGFRNFKAFNLAMVAKQGWSFLSKPESLVARVFKSRYFPRSSFLGAKLGYNPSFAWRSIWNSRQLLLYGCRWTIRNGQQVSVMNDPWVRGGHGSWIQSPQSQGVHSLRVSDLIVDEERVWDIDKLESLFPDDMVQAILDTPLFAEVQNDKIVWTMERNGRYTVKTGYKLAMMELLHTDRFHVEGEWHRIWNVNSPHKARNLLWRICRGCVPTRLRLQSRHVQCEVICPWCVM